MKNVSLITLGGVLWIGQAHAESPAWQTQVARPLSEIAVMKSQNDFVGSVLAVTDADWKQKWATPPEVTPSFNKAEVVGYGSKVFILILFSNPAQDEQQASNIRCDLKIIDPKGNAILTKQDMVCFSGQLASSPSNRYLSAPVISFAGEAGDPAGTWGIEVKLRDVVRGVELPLRTTFELTNLADAEDGDSGVEEVAHSVAESGQQDKSQFAPLEALPREVERFGQVSSVASAKKPLEQKSPDKGENWAVNLIAYQQDQLAQQKAEEFTAKGIPATVSQVAVKGEVWYRLSVGGFLNQQEATAYATRAKKALNLNAVWIGKNTH